jgi:hypothetical protein
MNISDYVKDADCGDNFKSSYNLEKILALLKRLSNAHQAENGEEKENYK